MARSTRRLRFVALTFPYALALSAAACTIDKVGSGSDYSTEGPPNGQCRGDGPAELPAATGYSTACDAPLHAILTTPAGTAPAECSAALEARAEQYYKDYWDGIYGYEDLAGGPDVTPYVWVTFHPGAGAVARVELHGEEDTMDFVFAADGQLLYYQLYNQSPDSAWFCAAGEPAAEWPDEDCARDAVAQSGYEAEDISQASGLSSPTDLAALPPALAAAIGQYASVEGVSSDADVGYDYRLWASYDTNGAEVTLTADGHPEVTYVVTGHPDEWGLRIVFRRDDSGISFVCQQR